MTGRSGEPGIHEHHLLTRAIRYVLSDRRLLLVGGLSLAVLTRLAFVSRWNYQVAVVITRRVRDDPTVVAEMVVEEAFISVPFVGIAAVLRWLWPDSQQIHWWRAVAAVLIVFAMPQATPWSYALGVGVILGTVAWSIYLRHWAGDTNRQVWIEMSPLLEILVPLAVIATSLW